MFRRNPVFRAVVLTLVVLLAATAVGAETESALPAGVDYGAGLTLEETTPLREVVSRPELHADRTLLVKGRIRDVCQKKGCWMVLADGEFQMRVRFADYGFFVPKDSSGKDAYVEGRAAVEEISEKHQNGPVGQVKPVASSQRVVSAMRISCSRRRKGTRSQGSVRRTRCRNRRTRLQANNRMRARVSNAASDSSTDWF